MNIPGNTSKLVLCLGTCFLATSSHAASTSLHGKVLDAAEAAIPNATLTAQCGPYQREAKSSTDGSFELEAAQSTCTITVQANGFASYTQVVTLPTGPDGRTLQVQLQVANVTSSITVQARQDAVDVAKMPADPMYLPLAIQSVPVGLAQDQGFTRLIDVVRNVSGVTSKEAYFGVTDTFNVRGFDASSSLYNGFRRDYYGSVNDLAHVDRVEVIKGPSSVTEGFLEPGGIINVVTKRPISERQAEFLLTSGTFGTYRGQYDAGTPLTQNFRIRSTGASEHTASFRDYVHSNRVTLGVAADWNPTPNTIVETNAYGLFLTGVPDRALPIAPESIAFGLPITRFLGDPRDVYRQRNNSFSTMVRHGFGRSWSGRAGANLYQLKDYRNNTQALGPDPENPNLYTRELTVVDGTSSFLNGVVEVSGEADTFHLHHHLVVGVDYQRIYTFYNFTENFDIPDIDPFNPVYDKFARVAGPTTSLFHGYTYDTGYYAQDLISVGSRIHVLAGVRQDQFNYHDADVVANYTTRLKQGALSPRVGIVYQPLQSWSIYGNYATSFNPQQGVVLLNGEDPTPSRGRQQELGIKYSSADHRWTASADLFRIRKTNVATYLANNPNFATLTGAEESRGAEFDSTFQPRRGLLLRANIADMRAIVTADETLPVGAKLINVPRLQGTLWAQGDIPHSPISAGFGWFAVGQRQAQLPNTFLIPKYNRLDAALYWHLRPGIELSANLQNFSNVKYYTSQDYSLFPGAPVNAVFSLKVQPMRRSR